MQIHSNANDTIIFILFHPFDGVDFGIKKLHRGKSIFTTTATTELYSLDIFEQARIVLQIKSILNTKNVSKVINE